MVVTLPSPLPGVKALSPQIDRSVRRSVVKTPPSGWTAGWDFYTGDGVLWLTSHVADGFPAWGSHVIYRDRLLRAFHPTESTVSSAFGTVVARNAAYSWTLDGPDAGVDRAHDLLMNANGGAGWLDFITRFCWDLYTQDKGAFVQLVRAADSPTSPVIGLTNLDAGRCWSTGIPETPVLYQDLYGKWVELKWYQVYHATELPAPHETLYGLQYSALSRVLEASKIFRNISIYMAEKTGGRQKRAIHVVSGVRKADLDTAVKGAAADAGSQGLTRYMEPVVLSTLAPDQKPEIATLEFASLPDNFDSEKEFKRFVTILSMGLLSDYQEFSPLPGGGLGSGAQSEVLSAKTRGKGPALFQKVVEHMLNFGGILPRSVEFRYAEQDLEQERADAEVAKLRAEAREIRVRTRELDQLGAMQAALDAGDLDQETFDRLSVLPDITGAGPRYGGDVEQGAVDGDSTRTDVEVETTDAEGNRIEQGRRSMNPALAGPSDERYAFEEDAAARLGRALARVRRDIRAALDAA